jgi:hypothetical protein
MTQTFYAHMNKRNLKKDTKDPVTKLLDFIRTLGNIEGCKIIIKNR